MRLQINSRPAGFLLDHHLLYESWSVAHHDDASASLSPGIRTYMSFDPVVSREFAGLEIWAKGLTKQVLVSGDPLSWPPEAAGFI